MTGYYPEIRNRFPLHIGHRNQNEASANSPYESIDQFQLEQRRQLQNGPGQTEARYDYEDQYSNQFRNDQESYYQSLLRVTENPLRDLQDQEPFSGSQKPDAYYQDYLTLDENESFNPEQDNPKEKYGNLIPPKSLGSINEKVKNSTDQKIAALMTKLLMKQDSYSPSSNDLETLNSFEDEMIAQASVPDEIKRGVRQVRGQDPGFLWTLARLAFEKVNDTKSAVNQIGTIISDNISSDDGSSTASSTTTSTTTTTSPVIVGDAASSDTSTGTTTDDTTTTTTEAPFRLTSTILQGIIRRNLKGLIRLFNIEWRDALNASRTSVREFHRDLGNQVRPYLESNPNVNG